ncbi:MAG: hypothetical protein KDK60_00270 [Chlamydiia bacterium]|nr:hypothetical protein [Chlamydiia bacterium]
MDSLITPVEEIKKSSSSENLEIDRAIALKGTQDIHLLKMVQQTHEKIMEALAESTGDPSAAPKG